MARTITERFSALYFPYINIRDENWLKISLLLWKSIHRIVPHDYPKERIYRNVSSISNNPGIIESIDPGQYSHIIEDRFIDFIESNIQDLDRFRLDADIIRNTNSHRSIRHRFSESGLGRQIPGISFIYSEKMGHRLQEVLLDNDLGVIAGDEDYHYMRWVGVDRKIAALYMTFLANTISQDQRLNPITDSGPHLAAIGDDFNSAAKILLSSETEVDKRLGRSNIYDDAILLSIKRYIPQDISRISLEEIIEFRKKRSKELSSFRKYIMDRIIDFETGKSNISSSALQSWMKEEIFVDLDDKVAEIDEVYRDLGQELIPNILNIKVTAPTIVSAMVSHATQSPTLAATGFAISLIPTIAAARKSAQQTLKGNPASFLYNLRGLGKINRNSIIRQLGYRSRNFVFGE